MASETLFQLLSVYMAGLLSSLTPCVYPMIPITLSVFGATGDTSRTKSALLSLAYVFGIAVTYTTLGMITARTGMIFGSLLGNPVVVLFLFAFLLLLSLQSLEIVTFNLAKLQTKAGKLGGKGYMGSFVMGLVSGVVAAPCVGPVLAVVLLEAANSKHTLWGATLLFTYSIGLGTIFLVLGTFRTVLHKLPRSGGWLNGVKYIIAVGVLVSALFLVSTVNYQVVSATSSFLLDHQVFLAVLALGSLMIAMKSYQYSVRSGKFGSALIISLFLVTFVLPKHESGDARHLSWVGQTETAFQLAREHQRPVMLDLYADWCTACKKLDSKTFADQKVADALGRQVVTARLDFTSDTPQSDELSARYKVVGLPCILFLNEDGTEIPNTRISGFLSPEDFLKHLEKIERAV
ncbi:MAG: thioredoxin family protein [Bdellovibrionales bacterium]|nr:thioredoxin family protein [Bdellovibrionales bacterium]